MDKQHEKLMTNLQRILATQDFKTDEEIQYFLDNLLGKEIPSFPKEALSFEEQAQDLVFEAHKLPPQKAKLKIIKALELNPDCIEAFEYLGLQEPVIEIGIAYFNMGISIGRQIFGGEFLKENKGMFWGMFETRPFMRCMQQYADCLYSLGKIEESVEIMKEMIELNHNDNLGVRSCLMLYLIELNHDKDFLKYTKMFDDEGTASYLFNQALFAFKTKGDGVFANQKLNIAINQNGFVHKKLLSRKIPMLPTMYGIGDEGEADYYAFYAQIIWQETIGALNWLKKHNKK